MATLANERSEELRLQHDATVRVTAYLRDRASPYAARVSAWWLEVTAREGCKPISYYDQ
jgi:hypothetical protein